MTEISRRSNMKNELIVAACQKAGNMPPPGWSKPDPTVKPISASDLSLLGQSKWNSAASCRDLLTLDADVGSQHSMGLAIHVYPMYENGLRAHTKQTQQENQKESEELYAAFDEIACNNPYSWRFGETPRDAKSIGTITKRNRMICTPCKTRSSSRREEHILT